MVDQLRREGEYGRARVPGFVPEVTLNDQAWPDFDSLCSLGRIEVCEVDIAPSKSHRHWLRRKGQRPKLPGGLLRETVVCRNGLS